MHEGLLCYVCFLNRWPAMYPSIAEMPLEAAEVFLFCLRSEEAAEGSNEELQQFQTATEDLWRAMGILPPTG